MAFPVVSRETFSAAPRPGVAASGATYYTEATGGRLMGIAGFTSRSDTTEAAQVRFSDDDGQTWGEPTDWPTRFDHPDGTGRRHPRGGYVDTPTGRYITVWTEGVLPTDEPLEGMRQWKLHYSVSEDGGRNNRIEAQIIHQGSDYDAVRHLPGVEVGKNCVMIGDLGQRPLTRSDGTLLVPVQSSPAGPDGVYHNPGAGFTYTDCLLLLGSWRADGDLDWTASQRVVGNPERTTRGLIEPTIAELDDGSILMVMRGSNDVRPDWPGHKWCCRSHDGGLGFGPAQPWTYDDGQPFFSPSACSQLIPLADGRLLWMGNISAENPRGNSPRYPLILGEVDRKSGCLLRQSVSTIDDRTDDESPFLTLSNFYAREDRSNGDLLLHLSRYFSRDFRRDGSTDWSADALLYRIALD
jgi:hypothetical protein